MANRNLTHAQVLNRGEVVICGSFAPNGTDAVDAASNTGTGWSVARTGVGIFVVTLQDKWVGLFSAQVSVQLSSGGARAAQLGDIDVASAKTVLIRTVGADGSPADIDANANNRIHFVLRLRNSTVQPA
jgi:hypothetical protein